MINRLGFVFVFLALFSLSFVSANFACGQVNDSEDFSAAWLNAQIYYSENPSDVLDCQINPDNKFCCDLEEIHSVSWEIGKEINAEVFDSESGYVAGSVKTIITGEGYDIFPEMKLEKPLKINSKINNILINQSEIELNVSLSEKYPNLRYFLNSSSGNSEGVICENCTSKIFVINLESGENSLELMAYGQRNFSETLNFFNLDYLEIENSFSCETGCRENKNKFYVPQNSEIIWSITINSSHNFSGELIGYIPKDWTPSENISIEDFSNSHNLARFYINTSNPKKNSYILTSPNVRWLKKYIFISEFSDISEKTYVSVLPRRSFPKFLSLPKRFSKHYYFFETTPQKTTRINPLILKKSGSSLDYVAIYPEQKISGIHGSVILKKSFFSRKQDFLVVSNVPKNKIEKTLVSMKVPEGKSPRFYVSGKRIYPEVSKKTGNYVYYEFDIGNKNSFSVRTY